jgi:serine/threonine protein kinase
MHLITHNRNANGVDVSLQRRVQWLRDIMEALCYLHERRVLHGDINCQNVLLREDMTALMGGFAMSMKLSSSQAAVSSSSVNTPLFTAPEVNGAQEKKHMFGADIYSFGMTTLELLLSCPPSSQQSGLVEMQELIEKGGDLAFQLEQLRRIALHCTLIAQNERPNAQQVLHWLNSLLKDRHNAEVPLDVVRDRKSFSISSVCKMISAG